MHGHAKALVVIIAVLLVLAAFVVIYLGRTERTAHESYLLAACGSVPVDRCNLEIAVKRRGKTINRFSVINGVTYPTEQTFTYPMWPVTLPRECTSAFEKPKTRVGLPVKARIPITCSSRPSVARRIVVPDPPPLFARPGDQY